MNLPKHLHLRSLASPQTQILLALKFCYLQPLCARGHESHISDLNVLLIIKSSQ